MNKLLVASLALTMGAGSALALNLGSFNFNAGQMGDYLIESDGGAYRASNWLNLANADPGNPGALTGANFDTGVANIGISGRTLYTIGYNSAILDLAGDDVGIVVARYSQDDVQMELFDGSTWSSAYVLPYTSAVSTGEHRNYYYGVYGLYDSELFVHAIDLNAYGITQLKEIRLTVGPNSGQLDLIRAGGLNPVPEPASMAVLAFGAAALARRRRR